MPSLFNVLICILALLIGVLIGEKYRKWKKGREEKKEQPEDHSDESKKR